MSSNVHAQNYFEHIGNIGVVNFGPPEATAEHLHLLILGCITENWENCDAVENVPVERYGEEVGDWKVYQDEQLKILLEEFNQQSSINLQVYYLCPSDIEEGMEDQIEPLTKNLILILDPFSLSFDHNRKVAELFNTKDKNKMKGCLVPICTELEAAQKTLAGEQLQSVLSRVYNGWSTEFYKSYSHVELDVPNKLHFFRRLSNIAYLREIKEKETMAKIKLTSKKLEQPPRP